MNGNKETGTRHHRLLAGIGIIILIGACVLIAVIMTLTISTDQPGRSETGYPYTTTFLVSLPEGETVQVGDQEILVLSTGDSIALRIGDHREEMHQGEEREIADRTVTVQTLGQTVFETGYRFSATWVGMEGKTATFRVTLRSSRQIPDWLISRVIPQEIRATPA